MGTWEEYLPSAELEICEEHVSEFFRTMHERHMIWIRKYIYEQESPFSKDVILRDYKFCNIYRMLDRTTQYLIQNRTTKINNPKQFLFDVIVFRVMNSPETMEEINFPNYRDFNIKNFVETLRKYEEEIGFKTLNDDAYKINTYVWKGLPRWKAYAENIIGEYHKKIDRIYDVTISCGKGDIKTWLREMKVFGVGYFLIHEIYQDLCDLSVYGSTELMRTFFPFDKSTWTNVGPGAQMGCRLLFPAVTDYQWCLETLKEIAPKRLEALSDNKNFPYVEKWNYGEHGYFAPDEPNITLHEIEFWLCEYTKYVKMKVGAGKQRKKYQPS